MRRREQVYTVIAPVATAWKLRDGERLDGSYAQSLQARKLSNQAVKGAAGGSGADVALIDHQALRAYPMPASVVPFEGVWVHHG